MKLYVHIHSSWSGYAILFLPELMTLYKKRDQVERMTGKGLKLKAPKSDSVSSRFPLTPEVVYMSYLCLWMFDNVFVTGFS